MYSLGSWSELGSPTSDQQSTIHLFYKANNIFFILRNYGFPDDLRTQGLISGIFSSVFSLGYLLGPILGSALVERIGFDLATFGIAICLLISVNIT